MSDLIVPEDRFSGADEPGSVWPMGLVRPDFKMYPSKVEHGGHVYCVDLGGGLVKAGRTNNPEARLRTHYVDALRFGVTPVRVWIGPAHKEFAESERLMLAMLRSKYEATGPESFRGAKVFESIQDWWKGREVLPAGQTEDERNRQEESQKAFTEGLRRLYGGSAPDPLAGVKANPGLLSSLSTFFSDEPVETRTFLREEEWSEDATETARELFSILEEVSIDPELDVRTATWLDLMEHMAFTSIRTAKWKLERQLKEVNRESPMMKRLIDTIPGADQVVA